MGSVQRSWTSPGADRDELVATTDRGTAPLTSMERDDEGAAYSVTVAEGARWLAIERHRGGALAARWRLDLGEQPPDPLLDDADRLRRTDPERADEMLRAAASSEAGTDRGARIDALRARIALARGRTDEAARGLRRSFAAARAAGRVSDAAHDAFALAHILVVSQLAFAEGRSLLAEAASLTSGFPEGAAELSYYQGLLALQSGNMRGALHALAAASRASRRLGMEMLAGYADTELGVTLAALGRGEEALALGRQAAERSARRPRDGRELPCNRAEPHVDLAWIAMLVWRGEDSLGHADSAGSVDPAPLLARARAALAKEGCTDPSSRWNMALDEALFAIAQGRAPDARARLASTADAPPSPYLAVWASEAWGRLALLEGQPALAQRLFAHEQALAGAAGFVDGLVRAQIGSGRALLAQGRRAAAAQALQEAQDGFEVMLRSVPLGEGRDTFLSSYDESARFLIDALVRLGQVREAFAVARLRRVRALVAMAQSARLDGLGPDDRRRWDQALATYRAGRAALEEEARDDWKLPADALARARESRRAREQRLRALLDDAQQILYGSAAAPAASALGWPRSGELYVAYVPGERGWLALLATSAGVVARALPGPPGPLRGSPAELGARLLSPIARELAVAGRVRFFPHGALAGVDLHALPLAGHALGEVVPVEYGVDIPFARPAAATRLPPGLLIVDDPSGNLRRATAEGRGVEAATGGRVAVRRLEARDATREQVLELLPRSRSFHYAGHGSYAGVEGLDSALPLAGGGRLLAADVLALPAAPEMVTLSACQAAGSSRADAVSVPLGLGEAFLAAGSLAVVASARSVHDEVASDVMLALYRALAAQESKGGEPDLAQALATAERELKRSAPDADWSAFRLLVR
jgi:hypothetical protein